MSLIPPPPSDDNEDVGTGTATAPVMNEHDLPDDLDLPQDIRRSETPDIPAAPSAATSSSAIPSLKDPAEIQAEQLQQDNSAVISGEQAMIADLLSRKWVTRSQIDHTKESMDRGQLPKPLHKALLVQNLISAEQAERLAEFIDKDLTIAQFQVERKLGSGAMGDVYLAAHQETKEISAVKLINKRFAEDEQFLARFQREIEALQGLSHPHVAGAIAHGIHEGLPYLAMQYVDGPSLSHLMNEHGPLPETYVLRIMKQIASGLDYVYSATNLVHRDIKPENILAIAHPEEDKSNLYNRHDTAKLIDFGLARSFKVTSD